jgi:microcystin-dependent protein
MARNGAGTYAVPNSFTSGTVISSSATNANFVDVGSEITNSLPRDGQAGMTGQFKAASGSAAAPGISFGSDTDTGLYRKAGDTIGIVAGGTEVGTISANGCAIADVNGGIIAATPTGAMTPYVGTTAPTGWVRANGRTLGNASSGGTERANADTETLFTLLWNQYSNSVCAVSGGRGASASADYAANKTITLPDLRGRAFFGLDDMGSTAASRLGSIITTPTTNGSSGGTETHTLTEAQMPVHQHSGTSLGATTTISGGTNIHSGSTNASYDSGPSSTKVVSSVNTITASTTISGSVGQAGSGQAHSNMPPAFLGTYIIKL